MCGRQGKTPGGIGFALTFLLLLFFLSRQRKVKPVSIMQLTCLHCTNTISIHDLLKIEQESRALALFTLYLDGTFMKHHYLFT